MQPAPAPLSKPPTSLVQKGPFWSRPSVRASTMVFAFAALMIVTNSAASALGSPAAALLIGPVLGVLVLWLYSVAVRRIEQRPVTELARPTAAKRLLLDTLGGLTLACVSIGLIAAFGGYQIVGWGHSREPSPSSA